MARIGLGRLAWLEGGLERAAPYFYSALDEAVKAGRPVQIWEALEGLALVLKGQNDAHAATYLLGAVESLRRSLYRGDPPDYRGRLAAQVDQLGSALGEAEFQSAWTSGGRLWLKKAVTYGRQRIPD